MKLLNKLVLLILFLTFIIYPQDNIKKIRLDITSKSLTELTTLKMKRKSDKDTALFYPGAVNEQIRKKAENLLNDMVDNLINNIKSNPYKEYVLRQFKEMLTKFNDFDSDDRDRVCSYCEEIMDILKIESSDGFLMEWRYGFK